MDDHQLIDRMAFCQPTRRLHSVLSTPTGAQTPSMKYFLLQELTGQRIVFCQFYDPQIISIPANTQASNRRQSFPCGRHSQTTTFRSLTARSLPQAPRPRRAGEESSTEGGTRPFAAVCPNGRILAGGGQAASSEGHYGNKHSQWEVAYLRFRRNLDFSNDEVVLQC